MRGAAAPLPPEEIWLGEPWEEPPAPRRRSRAASVPARPAARRSARPAASIERVDEPRPAQPAGARRSAPPATGIAPPPADRPERAPVQRTPIGRAPAERAPAERTPAERAPAERRTVTIRGRGAERDLTYTAGQSRRRPSRPAHERPGFRPDRAAMWAVLLGLLLVLVAATSSHAAVIAPHTVAARTRDGVAPAARLTVPRAASAVRAHVVLHTRA